LGESLETLRYTLRPKQADVAQLVEQLTRNEQVSGSSPLVGSLSCLQIPQKIKAPDIHVGGFGSSRAAVDYPSALSFALAF
jgi:hypothetical protein